MDILFLLIGLAIIAGVGSLVYLKARLYLAKLNELQLQSSDQEGADPNKTSIRFSVTEGKSALLLRAFMIAMISVLALLPQDLVMEMTQDRSLLYRGVVDEIGQTWGAKQTIAGPALMIPYSYERFEEVPANQGMGSRQVKHQIQDQLIVLPNELNIDVGLKHDFRHRGIYQSLVYKSQIQGKAQFNALDLDSKSLALKNKHQANNLKLDVDNARVVFGISANQGIEKVDLLNIAGEGVKLKGRLVSGTGLLQQAGFNAGFHQGITVAHHNQISVEFAFDLRGSEAISLLPLGEKTAIGIQADWPHPSFSGLLPIDRTIDATGFNATWQISHLNRNYPQAFSASEHLQLDIKSASVSLFEPVSHYAKVERAVKYGLLFIGLTFIMLFILELSQSQKLSLIQYLLVACAMSLFYLLLLSLAEHTSFSMAYLIAAMVPVLSISAYIGSATRSYQRGGIIFILLLSLYALLYSILKLEDYALLMGTGLILVVLLTLMYLTRGTNRTEY